MAVRIRLKRRGRKKLAMYDIIVADARAPRDGKFIEKLGLYNPNTDPATIELNADKAFDWVMDGAQPSDTARTILSHKGVMIKKHLQIGVNKGAITQEAADKKYAEWMKTKDAKTEAKIEGLASEKAATAKTRFEAETKIKEDRAEALLKKQSEMIAAEEAAAKKAEAEAAGEDADAADTAETKEGEDAPVAETTEAETAPVEEAKAEEPAPEKVEAKEEAPAEEAKEEPAKPVEAKVEAPVEEKKEEVAKPAEEKPAKEEAKPAEAKVEKKEAKAEEKKEAAPAKEEEKPAEVKAEDAAKPAEAKKEEKK